MNHKVILFYAYVHIEEPQRLLEREKAVCEVLDLKGRVIIAEEGINSTLEGRVQDIRKYIQHIRSDRRFKYIDIKESEGTGKAFPRLSLRVRPEIVSSHLDATVNPRKKTGVHLSPAELKKWFSTGKDFEIIDMRNEYEYAVGHFKGSHNSGMHNFRDVQSTVPKFAKFKEKPVVTVCTGGVRCEKASAYLLTQGFKEVYQLNGGLHRYMEQFPGEDFVGVLYTFDDRVTMHFSGDAERDIVGHCTHCDALSETFADCALSHCGNHFIVCTGCNNEEGKALCKAHRPVAVVV